MAAAVEVNAVAGSISFGRFQIVQQIRDFMRTFTSERFSGVPEIRYRRAWQSCLDTTRFERGTFRTHLDMQCDSID